jgi:hypothetical protein
MLILITLKINVKNVFYFQAESEKLLLSQNLRESQANVERSQVELQTFMARVVQLAARVDSLQHLYQKADQQFEENNQVCLMLISKWGVSINSTVDITCMILGFIFDIIKKYYICGLNAHLFFEWYFTVY